MTLRTRYALQSLAANLGLGLVCVALFLRLPFGTVANGISAAALRTLAGLVIDRRFLARLPPEDRAAEMRARKDADF
ncbi:MAG: hypothetical protein ACKVPY_08755 [Paracoccaceae bacterium]